MELSLTVHKGVVGRETVRCGTTGVRRVALDPCVAGELHSERGPLDEVRGAAKQLIRQKRCAADQWAGIAYGNKKHSIPMSQVVDASGGYIDLKIAIGSERGARRRKGRFHVPAQALEEEIHRHMIGSRIDVAGAPVQVLRAAICRNGGDLDRRYLCVEAPAQHDRHQQGGSPSNLREQWYLHHGDLPAPSYHQLAQSALKRPRALRPPQMRIDLKCWRNSYARTAHVLPCDAHRSFSSPSPVFLSLDSHRPPRLPRSWS